MAQILRSAKNDPNNASILLRSGYLKKSSLEISKEALAEFIKNQFEVDPTF